METIAQLLKTACDNMGDRCAYKVDGRSIGYRALYSNALVNARRLLDKSPGRVAVYCKGLHEFMTSLYGAILCGKPPFLISTDVPSPEVEHLADRFSVDVIFTDDKMCLTNKRFIAPEEDGVGDKNADSQDLPGGIQEDDAAVILMTSGTTGSRQAVPITHRNLVWTGREFNKFMGLSEATNEMVLVPLTHSFGLRRLVAQLLVGGCIVTLGGPFNPAAAALVVLRERCETMSAVPSHVRMFMGRFREEFKIICKQLRFVELSSAFLSADEKAELVERLSNAQIVMGYGLTEATRSALLRLEQERNKLETVGRPSSGVELIIVNEREEPVSAGEVGEIIVKGPNVAHGYLKESDGGQDRFSGDSFKTGDLGFLDQDGYLTLIGRSDDIINVGGRKFHPSELEQLLSKHFPHVDCAISKKPDRVLGFRPVLCVTDEDLDTSPLHLLIEERCEPYKRPAEVIRFKTIPRTANGKVIRAELMRMIASSS